jgi:hypothetical protein
VLYRPEEVNWLATSAVWTRRISQDGYKCCIDQKNFTGWLQVLYQSEEFHRLAKVAVTGKMKFLFINKK